MCFKSHHRTVVNINFTPSYTCMTVHIAPPGINFHMTTSIQLQGKERVRVSGNTRFKATATV